MLVPLVDVAAQYRTLESQIQSCIGEVLREMRLSGGKHVRALEQEFADHCGARFGVGLGSGSDALLIALRTMGLKSGDEVITVSHTFVATAEAIVLAGARPVFVDIDPETYTMDPNKVEDAINHRTRVIVPVHIYGHPADMESLLAIARSRGLRVIEDASQAHGARHLMYPVGSLGDAACFSFHYSNNLGAYGEAGILVTSDEEIAKRARALRDHGSDGVGTHESTGYNSRLDEIQAAIVRVKLPLLDQWNDRRRMLAQIYGSHLESLPLHLPVEKPWAWHVYHRYVVRTALRDSLHDWLQSQGIITGIHYPTPLHQYQAYKFYGHRRGSMVITEQVAREVLSLPMYPELEQGQLEQVVGAIQQFFARNGTHSGRRQHIPVKVHTL